MAKRPLVAIVGRPNVGKSLLFNRLCGKRLSIVEDTPGVTRDRLYAECEWAGRTFDIVDTGGIEPTADSEILLFMREQAEIAINSADVIVFATPIYYYEMSGQLKTLLDRANALFPSDYAFRDIYLLASATEDEPDTDERAIHGLEGWIACYEKCRLAGTVFAGGVTEPGAVAGHPALETARAMGAAIA